MQVRFFRVGTVLTAFTLVSAFASAQSYPNRPVRLIVPYAPGGGTDIVARMFAQRLTESFGHSVVVDNRASAGGIVGTELVAKAAADGYTLLMLSSAHTIAPNLYVRVPYEPIKDFAPISQVTSQPYILGIHPGVPARSVKELIALATTKPGQINYASGGSGTAPHLAAELFRSQAGIKIVHIPYKGGGPAVLALMSGEVAMLFSSLPSTIPQVKAGKIRALAVSSLSRSPAAPELPTVAEAGVADFEVVNWYGVAAPAKTAAAIVARLSAELLRVLQTTDMRDRLAADGTDAVGSTPEAFGAYLQSELVKWSRVIKSSGMRAD